MRLSGKNLIDGYVEETDAYKAAANNASRDAITSEELERFIMVLFLRNTNYD